MLTAAIEWLIRSLCLLGQSSFNLGKIPEDIRLGSNAS
jgi:hypothetical protein